MQRFLFLYLAPPLLHYIGNLLAYVASLFVASVTKFARACGADVRTGDSNYPSQSNYPI